MPRSDWLPNAPCTWVQRDRDQPWRGGRDCQPLVGSNSAAASLRRFFWRFPVAGVDQVTLNMNWQCERKAITATIQVLGSYRPAKKLGPFTQPQLSVSSAWQPVRCTRWPGIGEDKSDAPSINLEIQRRSGAGGMLGDIRQTLLNRPIYRALHCR